MKRNLHCDLALISTCSEGEALKIAYMEGWWRTVLVHVPVQCSMHWAFLPRLDPDNALLVEPLINVCNQRRGRVSEPPADKEPKVNLLDWHRGDFVRNVLVKDDHVARRHSYPHSLGIVRGRVGDLGKAASPTRFSVRAFGVGKVVIVLAEVYPTAKDLVCCWREWRLISVPTPNQAS